MGCLLKSLLEEKPQCSVHFRKLYHLSIYNLNYFLLGAFTEKSSFDIPDANIILAWDRDLRFSI